MPCQILMRRCFKENVGRADCPRTWARFDVLEQIFSETAQEEVLVAETSDELWEFPDNLSGHDGLSRAEIMESQRFQSIFVAPSMYESVHLPSNSLPCSRRQRRHKQICRSPQ